MPLDFAFDNCGGARRTAAGRIGSHARRHAYEGLRCTVVIVDTPPALALALAVQGLLLVARVNATNRDALAASTSQLRHVGASLLGVVLNAVPATSGYGYGYAYSYGDYAGDGKANGRRNGTGAGGRVGRLLRRTKARR